jgi:hypothetical protein
VDTLTKNSSMGILMMFALISYYESVSSNGKMSIWQNIPSNRQELPFSGRLILTRYIIMSNT